MVAVKNCHQCIHDAVCFVKKKILEVMREEFMLLYFDGDNDERFVASLALYCNEFKGYNT